MEGFDGALREIAVHRAIGGQHEFLDEAVGDVALAADDADHALLVIESDDLFGKIEIDGAVLAAASVKEEGQLFHVARSAWRAGRSVRSFRDLFR